MKKIRPDLIYVSMPGFGDSGPWRNYLAYGIGQEQLSGIAHMTGYEDEGPMKSGINHGDPISGSHAAGVILAALRYRKVPLPVLLKHINGSEPAIIPISSKGSYLGSLTFTN